MSGECFYLPRKWHCNDSKKNSWNECDMDYSFDEDEINGTQLIKNLCWLGKSNELMDLIGSIKNHDDEIVGGGGTKNKSHQSDDFDDRTLRKAIPEMNSTLSNWTLHGQNLGGMLRNYKKQYRNLRQSQRRELGHFFNTASAVLDTISSMTENSILRSVKFGGDEPPSKSLIS